MRQYQSPVRVRQHRSSVRVRQYQSPVRVRQHRSSVRVSFGVSESGSGTVALELGSSAAAIRVRFE